MSSLNRRSFLRLPGAAMGAAAAVGLYTWRVQPRWLDLVYRELPIRGLPAPLVGRTLVHLSDIHVGLRVDSEFVVSAFRRIAALRPDIVVLTGDLVSYHRAVFDRLPAVYRHFPLGTDGHAGDSGEPRLRSGVVTSRNPVVFERGRIPRSSSGWRKPRRLSK